MSYSVRLMLGDSLLSTLATHKPFLEPEHEYDFDDDEPPLLCAVRRIFTIEGVFYGSSESSAGGQYATLLGILENPNSYPDTIELLGPGGSVAEISKESGYDSFKIEAFRVHRSDLEWRGEFRYTLRITGVLKFGPAITKLTLQDTYTWDEAGLLTQTRQGEIVTRSGTSAKDQAQTQGLELPSSQFAFMTKGPGGVDIHVLDKADTRARFTCTIRQSGGPLPALVGPSFSVTTTEELVDGDSITTIVATARGPGSKSAVQSFAPAGFNSSSVAFDPYTLTATARYVKRAPARGPVLLREYSFESSGGGRSIKFTPRTGGREPARHVGPFLPVEVRESIRVELTGLPGLINFTLPSPLATGKDFARDESGDVISSPRRISIGASEIDDRWAVSVRRIYRGLSLKSIFTAIGAAIGDATLRVDLDDEAVQEEGE